MGRDKDKDKKKDKKEDKDGLLSQIFNLGDAMRKALQDKGIKPLWPFPVLAVQFYKRIIKKQDKDSFDNMDVVTMGLEDMGYEDSLDYIATDVIELVVKSILQFFRELGKKVKDGKADDKEKSLVTVAANGVSANAGTPPPEKVKTTLADIGAAVSAGVEGAATNAFVQDYLPFILGGVIILIIILIFAFT